MLPPYRERMWVPLTDRDFGLGDENRTDWSATLS